MCNCKTDIEAQLTERFKAAAPTAEDHKVTLQGYGFAVVGNTMHMQPFMSYSASADYPKKGGGTRWKVTKGNMIFRFCPFCGEKNATAT